MSPFNSENYIRKQARLTISHAGEVKYPHRIVSRRQSSKLMESPEYDKCQYGACARTVIAPCFGASARSKFTIFFSKWRTIFLLKRYFLLAILDGRLRCSRSQKLVVCDEPGTE